MPIRRIVWSTLGNLRAEASTRTIGATWLSTISSAAAWPFSSRLTWPTRYGGPNVSDACANVHPVPP